MYTLHPLLSVTCIAAFYQHPSFDVSNKQDGSKSANHSPLAGPSELIWAHLHQTNTGMHLFWLAHFKRKTMSKDRCKKDSYARNTGSGRV